MTIRAKVLQEIHELFSQNKLYYRVNELPFATAKNGYSNHEGAVLRQYLRENGYIRVRISAVDKDWLAKNNINLKYSNVIIIKQSDYVPRNTAKGIDRKNFQEPTASYISENQILTGRTPEVIKDWFNADLIFWVFQYDDKRANKSLVESSYKEWCKYFSINLSMKEAQELFSDYPPKHFDKLLKTLIRNDNKFTKLQ